MTYLIDTDWVIDGISTVPSTLETLSRLAVDGIAVSVMTLGEVYEGAFSFPDPQTELAVYRRFLSGYPILPLTDAVMERFAQLRSNLRHEGNLIPDFDLLIAATALEHGLTLLTRNIQHFERVPDLVLYPGSDKSRS